MKTYGKVYTTRQEKINDFLIGYFGCLILNGLYGAVVWGLTTLLSNSQTSDYSYAQVSALVAFSLPLLINAVAIVVFMFTRVWIALGILGVFATLFVLVLCASLVFMTVCFGLMVSYR